MAPRDFLILLGLAAGERHGYGLIREIRELSDGGVEMDPANLYRAIKRLQRDALVRDLGRKEMGDERRRYYALTDLGQQRVRAESLRLERLTRVARERRLVPNVEGGS